jgi:hypothetical protein
MSLTLMWAKRGRIFLGFMEVGINAVHHDEPYTATKKTARSSFK